ncbi:MAG: hypothetical protein M3R24_28175 [Chloroflexota bacterium]|nr:hypothetical protein [Chloroflexota bacterium]
MPLQQGVRLDQENELAKASTSTSGQSRELAGEDDTREFLVVGDARRVAVLPLQNTGLLAQKQDLDIFVMLRSVTSPGEVEQQRERVREKKEKYARWWCRDHAEGRECHKDGAGAER